MSGVHPVFQPILDAIAPAASGVARDPWHVDEGGCLRDENGLLVRPMEALVMRQERDRLLAALTNLVVQIHRCNPVDDHGHRMTMLAAYQDARLAAAECGVVTP